MYFDTIRTYEIFYSYRISNVLLTHLHLQISADVQHFVIKNLTQFFFSKDIVQIQDLSFCFISFFETYFVCLEGAAWLS